MITFNTKTIIYILLAYLILVFLTKTFHRKKFNEWFALPTGVLTNPGDLSPNSYYVVGSLKSNVTTTQTGSQFGGSGCTTVFPTTVYVPYVSTSSDDAVCVQNITSIYSDVPQTTTSCTSSNGTNFYRMWNKQANNIIDTLQTSGGLTITPAKFSGRTCSQQFSSLPSSAYIGFGPSNQPYLSTGAYTTTTAPSYCTPINASCNSGDALYEDTNQTCTQPTAGGSWFRYFTKKTSNLESLTLNASKFGGANCSTILSSNVYPSTKYINIITGTNGNPLSGPFDRTVVSSTGGFVSSYCSPIDAKCNTSDSILYSDPGASGGTNGTCFTFDNGSSYFRKFNKKVDNFETNLYTTAIQIYGGKTCTTQISSLPTQKYVGVNLDTNGNPITNPRNINNYNGLTSSYCQYADATCANVTIDNQLTNYTGTTGTPVLGSTLMTCAYTLSGSSTCNQVTGKMEQTATITSTPGTYSTCPVLNSSGVSLAGSPVGTIGKVALSECGSCAVIVSTDTPICNQSTNIQYRKATIDTTKTPSGSYLNNSCPVKTLTVNGVSGTYVQSESPCPTCSYTDDSNATGNYNTCTSYNAGLDTQIFKYPQLYSKFNPYGERVTPLGSYFNASCPYNFNSGTYTDASTGNLALPAIQTTCGAEGIFN